MKIQYNYVYAFLIFVALISSFSCDKNNDNLDDFTPPFTPAIPQELTTANIGVYVIGNDQVSNPLQMVGYYGNQRFDPSYKSAFGYFFAGPQTVDKYLSHFGIRSTMLLAPYQPFQYKGFNTSGSIKDYVTFRYSHFVNAGNVSNLGGGATINLPGNGTLRFPAKPFSDSDLDISYSFLVNYLDPTVSEFALNLPSLPFADENNRRYFLQSYGVYQINPLLTYCNCNVLSPAARFDKEVTLQIPIPADLLVTAPDSIETWHFNLDPRGVLNGGGLYWKKNGMAYKKNGFYETRTRDYGAINFAKPKDAVYTSLQLRTTNDIALPNTRFVIKNNHSEITEGRSDMDGNALVLLPVNENLSFNLINDHFYNYSNIQLPDQNLGSFSKASIKKVVLPDRTDIGTLEGKVYNCDGSSFGNGSLVISQKDAKDDYIVPVVNGKFKTANWLNVSFSVSTLSFVRAPGDTAFKVSTCLGSQYKKNLKRLLENFYACPNADSLYCNFQIDGKAQTFSGSVNKSTPILTAKKHPVNTSVSIMDGSKGLSFDMWILGGYFGRFSGSSPLMVNGVACRYGSDPELTIYRNDDVANGFMEGWFSVDYFDPNNVSHTMSGNFRIKIIP